MRVAARARSMVCIVLSAESKGAPEIFRNKPIERADLVSQNGNGYARTQAAALRPADSADRNQHRLAASGPVAPRGNQSRCVHIFSEGLCSAPVREPSAA